MSSLIEFLDLNQIDRDQLFEAMHMDIRETIFKEICKKMKSDPDFYCQVKKTFFSKKDLKAAEMVVRRTCHCSLPEEDISWMAEWLKAFFSKRDKRRAIGVDEKRQLLHKQNLRCAICGAPIDEKTAHVDHIIPWDYVGDNLCDNLQGLCSNCNQTKSNHVAVAVTNMILHLEG